MSAVLVAFGIYDQGQSFHGLVVMVLVAGLAAVHHQAEGFAGVEHWLPVFLVNNGFFLCSSLFIYLLHSEFLVPHLGLFILTLVFFYHT